MDSSGVGGAGLPPDYSSVVSQEQDLQLQEKAHNQALADAQALVGPDGTPSESLVKHLEKRNLAQFRAQFYQESLSSAGGTSTPPPVTVEPQAPTIPVPSSTATPQTPEDIGTEWFNSITNPDNVAGVSAGVIEGLEIDDQWKTALQGLIDGTLTTEELAAAHGDETAENLAVLGGYIKTISLVLNFARELLENLTKLTGEEMKSKMTERLGQAANAEEMFKEIEAKLKEQIEAAQKEAESSKGLFGKLRKSFLGTGIAGLSVGLIGAGTAGGWFGPVAFIAGSYIGGVATFLGVIGVGMGLWTAIAGAAALALFPVLLPVILIGLPLLIGVGLAGLAAGTLAGAVGTVAGAAALTSPIWVTVLASLFIADAAKGGGIFTKKDSDIEDRKNELIDFYNKVAELSKKDLEEGEELGEFMALILTFIAGLISMLTTMLENAGASLPDAAAGKAQGEFNAQDFIQVANGIMANNVGAGAIAELATAIGMERKDASVWSTKLSAALTTFMQLPTSPAINQAADGNGIGFGTGVAADAPETEITYQGTLSEDMANARNMTLNFLGLTPEALKFIEDHMTDFAKRIFESESGEAGPETIDLSDLGGGALQG